ncbi:Hdr-like menaquinol oxidoreductase integral membrane subunit [Trichinella spiralis]|uniref:Hdr-like menaquinol oxidoreductase integral membrane subunit n=1 Tax=Trichinella spiralis TaxID=6334 RepID=A0ABR3KRJ7_TRISP
MLIFGIVNSIITVILSALMLHFIYKRNGRRADLVLLKGFSFASICFAFGSAFSLLRRYFDVSTGASSMTEAWKCIVLNFYFIPRHSASTPPQWWFCCCPLNGGCSSLLADCTIVFSLTNQHADCCRLSAFWPACSWSYI